MKKHLIIGIVGIWFFALASCTEDEIVRPHPVADTVRMYVQYYPSPTVQHFTSWMFSLDSGTCSNEIEFTSGFLSAGSYNLEFESTGDFNSKLEFLFYDGAYLIHSVTFYTDSLNQKVVQLNKNYTSVRMKAVNNFNGQNSFSISNLKLSAK